MPNQRSAAYWRKRYERLEEAQHVEAAAFNADLRREYEQATARLQRDFDSWYARVAGNNGISLADARRLIAKAELEEFKWTLEEYSQKARNNGDGRWSKQLENASARVHISKLEQEQLQLQHVVNGLFSGRENNVADFFAKTYKDGYAKSLFTFQTGSGQGFPARSIDDASIQKVLHKPWMADGRNFSSRIWGNQEKLKAELQTTLTQGLMRGDHPRVISQELARKMEVSLKRAENLVYTESAYFRELGQIESYKAMGCEKVEISATLDSITCPHCGDLDGKVLDLKDAQPGVTVPIFHPRCRCSTMPFFDDMEEHRIARDEDRNNITVPGDMKYPEWREKFLTDSPKDGLIQGTDHFGRVIFERESLTNAAVSGIMKLLKPSKVSGFHFSDGTSSEITSHVRDAYVYTDSSGRRFIYPKGYDKKKQLIQPQRAMDIFLKVPKSLQAQAKDIQFLDYLNPKDAHWAKAYKRKGFRSFATGANGGIQFWRNDGTAAVSAMDDDWILRTFNHELAHSLDQTLIPGQRFSESQAWKNIIDLDSTANGGSVPTPYSAVSPVEDFAESIAEYAADPGAFAKGFPNRAKFLQGVIT